MVRASHGGLEILKCGWSGGKIRGLSAVVLPFSTHGYVNLSQILLVRDVVGHSPSVEAGLVDISGVRKLA